MVMPSTCAFCGETYGDAEEHWCPPNGGRVKDRCSNFFCDFNIAGGAICRGKNCLDYFSCDDKAVIKDIIEAGKRAKEILESFAISINQI